MKQIRDGAAARLICAATAVGFAALAPELARASLLGPAQMGGVSIAGISDESIAGFEGALRPHAEALQLLLACLEAICAIAIALFAAVLAAKTTGLHRAAQRLQEWANAQSEDARKAAAEAAKTAEAMHDMSRALKSGAEQIVSAVKVNKATADALGEPDRMRLRAYLAVNPGHALYQDRGRNLRFEARPLLVNVGFTPANEIRYRVKSALAPAGIDLETFDFTLPEPDRTAPALGPRSEFSIGAVVDEWVPDADVALIRRGETRVLLVWGQAAYKDIFEEEHQTTFAMFVHWQGDRPWFSPASRHNRQA